MQGSVSNGSAQRADHSTPASAYCRKHRISRVRSSQGFTLIETVVTIAIIAIAMTGIISVWSHATARSADPFWQVKTEALGKMYLDKIEHTPYRDLIDLTHSDEQIANSFYALAAQDYQGFKVALTIEFAGEEFALAQKQLKKATLIVTSPLGNAQHFVTYLGASKDE